MLDDFCLFVFAGSLFIMKTVLTCYKKRGHLRVCGCVGVCGCGVGVGVGVCVCFCFCFCFFHFKNFNQ